jgi:hypothetical protein
MIYRRDLIEHYDWLAGSKYLDGFLDESVVAIAMTAHGHGSDWVRYGASWMAAHAIVDKFELWGFVDRMREEDHLPWPKDEWRP